MRESRSDQRPYARGADLRLTEVRAGDVVRVVAVDGGERVTSRLNDMGLFVGTTVEKVRGNGRGPVIVRVGPCRLALGRGVAEKVVVETLR